MNDFDAISNEVKVLRETLAQYRDTVAEAKKEITKLRAENEKLKTFIESYRGLRVVNAEEALRFQQAEMMKNWW